jgi:FixJ family two-component response regulator
MPDLTGDQFAQALLSVRPGLPVIICTGYSQVITLQRAQELGVSGLLMKPVPSATLTRVVRETLAARDQ